MSGVYIVTFLSCFGAVAYAGYLAHKIEIQKVRNSYSNSISVASFFFPSQLITPHSLLEVANVHFSEQLFPKLTNCLRKLVIGN